MDKDLKVKHIYNHWLPPLLGAAAVTIFYTIYYADPEDQVPKWMVRHEMKHIEQIQTLGFFWFYVNYFMQYLQGRMAGKDHWKAYEDISFEIEAREAEKR